MFLIIRICREYHHYLFRNQAIKKFWCDLQRWMCPNVLSIPNSITKDNIVFGILLENKDDEVCCNIILCLAKFFIHKNRTLKTIPQFAAFQNEFKW